MRILLGFCCVAKRRRIAMRKSIGRPAWLSGMAVALAAFLIPSAAAAGSVTIDEDRGTFAIEAKDATVDEVLTRVGQSQGFSVERGGDTPGTTFSGRFTGPLKTVMARILENESHMIVHSATSKTGIARVLLLGPAETPAPPVAVAVPAAGGSTTGTSTIPVPKPLPREVVGPAPTAAPQPVVAKSARR